MVCKSNKTILCNEYVCSSTMNLLSVLTEAGKNFESVQMFENESSREAQMWSLESLKHLL